MLASLLAGDGTVSTSTQTLGTAQLPLLLAATVAGVTISVDIAIETDTAFTATAPADISQDVDIAIETDTAFTATVSRSLLFPHDDPDSPSLTVLSTGSVSLTPL